MTKRLTGKVALITGVASGMGRATAELFAPGTVLTPLVEGIAHDESTGVTGVNLPVDGGYTAR